MSGTRYFYEHAGKRCGPFSSAELRSLAAEGKILPDDFVNTESLDKRCPARSVKGLFDRDIGRRSPTALPTSPPPSWSLQSPPMPSAAPPQPPVPAALPSSRLHARATTSDRAAIGAALLEQGKNDEAIDVLRGCVQDDPTNEFYQILLAGAYHDRSCESWTHYADDDGSDAQLPTNRHHVEEALRYVELAEQLNLARSDPEAVNAIATRRETIERGLRRRFDGNVLVVVASLVFGFIAFWAGSVPVGAYFLIGGALYPVSCMAPNYLINRRDLVRNGMMPASGFIAEVSKGMHERRKEREDQEGLSAFFSNIVGGALWQTILLPIAILLNFVKNYAVR